VVARIIRRSILLYLLGMFYHGGLSDRWPNIQFSGVLQRIAACYFAASLLFLYCRVRTLVAVAIALLVGYWAAVTFIPFPDLKLDPPTVEHLAAQAGSHSPSAIAATVPQRVSGVYDEGRNLTNYLDFRFLPGKKPIGRYYINEGLLSTLPAISISLAGIFAALLLRLPTLDARRKTAWLLAGGATAVVVALLWSLQFPLIKRMWSSSFCLLAIGCSAMLFAVFYLVIDVWQMRRWCQPFVWIGSNAITIYLASSLFHFGKIADRIVGGDVKAFLDTHLAKGFGSLVSALVALALVVWLMRFLYQRKIFLRV
jgi:predicted acyltransferase